MIDIPIIDLFAGPGGLCEGFHQHTSNSIKFSTVLSIEKNLNALNTLKLRTFFRSFGANVPKEYYKYVQGEGGTREELFAAFPDEANAAEKVVHGIELAGSDYAKEQTDQLIKQRINSNKWWILIGGPPCQAYSVAGRSRMVGPQGRIKFETDHRHFLYREYLRILEKFRPPLFVMENVKGLVTACHGGDNMFDKIRSDLSTPVDALGYSSHGSAFDGSDQYQLFSLAISADSPLQLSPHDYVIESEKYGVPQSRHRVFFLGIRTDLGCSPAKFLTEEKKPVTVGEVIGDMTPLRSSVSMIWKKKFDEKTNRILLNQSLSESEQWNKIVKNSFILKDQKITNKELRQEISWSLKNLQWHLTTGGQFVPGKPSPKKLRSWFVDKKLKGFLNHETRSHMPSDFARYIFVSSFGKVSGFSPRLMDFPRIGGLLPDHNNIGKALIQRSGHFSDRFKVQLPDRVSTTIVSHIQKDGHYYIHYDPTQCRSLTVREVARLQTFPDNYFFEGSRTAQYEQVGNAVPPYLANQIADVVAMTLNRIIKKNKSSALSRAHL